MSTLLCGDLSYFLRLLTIFQATSLHMGCVVSKYNQQDCFMASPANVFKYFVEWTSKLWNEAFLNG